MSDREKYILAKNEGDLELLLELVASDEKVDSLFTNQSEWSSQMHQQTQGKVLNQHKKDVTEKVETEVLESDLDRDWMVQETLISHCALNQLTFLLGQKRKELRVHIYYGTDQRVKVCKDLIDMRTCIFRSFDEDRSLELRM